MNINWQFLKKPSVLIGAVVLFFVLLFLLNKGGSASGSTQVVNAGPSDAQVAAQMQLAGMQISAGVQGQAIQADYAKSQDTNQTQIALATIAAASQAQSLTVQQAIAAQTISAQVHGLDLQYQTSVAANAAQIQAMQLQANYGLAAQAINANVLMHQSDLQAQSYNLSQELAHVTDVRLHGGQRLAVLQNIINTNGAVTGGSSSVMVNIPQVSVGNFTPAGQLT